jgi:hypothetical protein
MKIISRIVLSRLRRDHHTRNIDLCRRVERLHPARSAKPDGWRCARTNGDADEITDLEAKLLESTSNPRGACLYA